MHGPVKEFEGLGGLKEFNGICISIVLSFFMWNLLFATSNVYGLDYGFSILPSANLRIIDERWDKNGTLGILYITLLGTIKRIFMWDDVMISV